MNEPWSLEWKIERYTELEKRWCACEECPDLCSNRTNVVLGHGNLMADIMIIGEKPGEEEDSRGIPFVGASGDCLNSLIENLGSSREEFFLDNVVACKTPENRDPEKKEKENCSKRLYETIYLVDPLLIVCAGKVATQFLMGSRATSIDSILGTIGEIEIPGRRVPVHYDATAIYHPAFILKTEVPDKNGVYPKGGAADRSFTSLGDVLTAVKSLRKEYDRYSRRPEWSRCESTKSQPKQIPQKALLKPQQKSARSEPSSMEEPKTTGSKSTQTPRMIIDLSKRPKTSFKVSTTKPKS